MSIINFEELKPFTPVPNAAERLLSKSEKEITFNLNLSLDDDDIIEADCYVIYWNTARGPAKGGIRFSPHVTLEETRVLAELMAWKTAISGIPFGGGKSGICLDAKKLSRFEKTAVVKEYVHMIALELLSGAYIPAPDLGTTPYEMAVIYGETHKLESVTGKPPTVGGLPGRREATGRGVAHSAFLTARDILKASPSQLTVAVQGFGNVGSWSAFFLHQMGARVIAVSDENGGIHNPRGLDIPALMKHIEARKRLEEYSADKVSNKDLLELKVDMLIPAAVENVLTKENAPRVAAKMIVEAANGPTTPEADAIFAGRKIPVVPDILANSGGVVASYVEWCKAKSGAITDAAETYKTVEDHITPPFAEMLALVAKHKITLRTAARIIALRELVTSMHDRGWI